MRLRVPRLDPNLYAISSIVSPRVPTLRRGGARLHQTLLGPSTTVGGGGGAVHPSYCTQLERGSPPCEWTLGLHAHRERLTRTRTLNVHYTLPCGATRRALIRRVTPEAVTLVHEYVVDESCARNCNIRTAV